VWRLLKGWILMLTFNIKAKIFEERHVSVKMIEADDGSYQLAVSCILAESVLQLLSINS
jgi:hypothetical protein